jgi:hypothetical protein
MKMIIIGTLQHRQSDIEVDSRLEGLVRRVIDVKSLGYSSLMCEAYLRMRRFSQCYFSKHGMRLAAPPMARLANIPD